MSISAVSKFKSIHDFPELVEYLGDELDWPIETDDFEEMTFEYSAAELGLDEKTAPKFLEIRRLRPLDNDQPWGIFFIRFDDTKLPVVALRRLLSKLVLNKRSTSNPGDRASWHENDLLLVSQTGNLGTKSISFAHFAANPEKTDLPILKILGWDDDDTGLKIEYVIETLREKLVWPDDPTDSEAWRAQWRDAFTLKNREVIQSSKEMAERLGQLALAVRTRLRELLLVESEEGPIHRLMLVFKENLISDLDSDSFSDMYAQTIAYGLLSARIINPKANTADSAHTMIPITNPFLKDLMETFLNVGGRSHSSGLGLDFDELGINEVVELLDNTNMEAVLRDFGDRNQKEDPVMHFFEGFLKEYDSKIRKDRGVFYTPQPVVSFIVRSVDEQLRSEFGLKDGLADTTTWGELEKCTTDLEIPKGTSPDQAFVQILDPATGTGTFPVEVIDLIYKTMNAKWQKQGNREAQIKELWNEYVPKHLLPRLYGYELMMAPYAIAHLKIGLKLYETGYRFNSDQRARIYLTNALEPNEDFAGTFAFAIPALAQEVEAVNLVKEKKIFTVVIGNPPYSYHSKNKGEWISNLISDYRYVNGEPLGERNPKGLQDDYVKFIRIAQNLLDKAGVGILSYITNHSYSDNPTYRGMRKHLMQSFEQVYFFDLHGNSKKQEVSLNGNKDENIFDIQQGVAILLTTKKSNSNNLSNVFNAELWGSRSEKYRSLNISTITSSNFNKLSPTNPYYLYIDQDTTLRSEYENFLRINEVFTVNSMGITTGNDGKYVGFNNLELERNPAFDPSMIRDVAYRPFDNRSIYYDANKIERARFSFMKHMGSSKNLALVVIRRPRSDKVANFFIARGLVDKCYISTLDNCQVLPLYLVKDNIGFDFSDGFPTNFSPALKKKIDELLDGSKRENDSGQKDYSPHDIFAYIYGTFHSANYRKRYSEFLKSDFPRLPITRSLILFDKIKSFGDQLIKIHLQETDVSPSTMHFGPSKEVKKVAWTPDNDGSVWIDSEGSVKCPRPGTSGFSPVPKKVWDFHIGNYRVCEKWLKDRGPKKGAPGRTLTEEDITLYGNIVASLSKTIQIMAEIDEAIDAHGGWPEAFIINDQK
jgi:predicted helicase